MTRLRVEGEPDQVDRLAFAAIRRVIALRLHLLQCRGRRFVDLQLEDEDAAGMLSDDIRAAVGLHVFHPVCVQ